MSTITTREELERLAIAQRYGVKLHAKTKREERPRLGEWTVYSRTRADGAFVVHVVARVKSLGGCRFVQRYTGNPAEESLGEEGVIELVLNDIKRQIRTQRRYISERHTGYRVNRYLDLMRDREINGLYRSKKPLKNDKSRWTAIELECVIPSDNKKDIFSDLNNDKELRRHLTWKTDGSIEPSEDNEEGVEYVLCCPTTKLGEYITKLTNTLIKHEVYVNDSCGLHVHLDQRQVSSEHVRKVVYPRLAQAQPLLQNLVKSDRLESTYCEESPLTWATGSRYRAINACAYQTHGTVEVRLHHGTLSASKITAWVDLLWAIVDCDNYPVEDRNSAAVIDYLLGNNNQVARDVLCSKLRLLTHETVSTPVIKEVVNATPAQTQSRVAPPVDFAFAWYPRVHGRMAGAHLDALTRTMYEPTRGTWVVVPTNSVVRFQRDSMRNSPTIPEPDEIVFYGGVCCTVVETDNTYVSVRQLHQIPITVHVFQVTTPRGATPLVVGQTYITGSILTTRVIDVNRNDSTARVVQEC